MITVFAQTIRVASLYGEWITEADVETYATNAPDYYQYLIDDAAAHGVELTVSHATDCGIAHYCDTDEEREYVDTIVPDFWEWYQAGGPMYSDYAVWSDGAKLGTYRARSAQHARDLCAQDAGYQAEADMERRLEQKSDFWAAFVFSN